MNQSDVEPYLTKSIKLLFSNDEDSSEQLRAMLVESIRMYYGSRKAQAVANLAADNALVKKRILNSVSKAIYLVILSFCFGCV